MAGVGASGGLTLAPTARRPSIIISPWSLEALGFQLAALTQQAGGASGTWPTANLAYYVPFDLTMTRIVQKMFVANGATSSGNFDLGIYTDSGTRLVSTGATAQGTISVLQEVSTNVSGYGLPPGRYRMAMAVDNTTATFHRSPSSGTQFSGPAGLAQQTTAYVLPSTATFAAPAASYLPLFGISFRTLVA